ncbi:hypothetical protein TDB9533_00849 [Thalassocella blandensis]|nr:hypothetical protein TDB9533_00849 [Thalassocella blandensis]
MSYSQSVIKQLGKDAPYSWFLFDQAKSNPRYCYNDFREQSNALEAYLDTFTVALNGGDDIDNWLDINDWGSCFILAALGVGHCRPDLFDKALDGLKEKQETHYREILDACRWYDCDDLSPWLLKLCKHSSPVANQTVLALARRQTFNISDEMLSLFIQDHHPAVRSQLFHWFGEQGYGQHLDLIKMHYSNENPQVAYAAARAGFLLNQSDAREYLKQVALSDNSYMREAIALLFIKQEEGTVLEDWLTQLWNSEHVSLRVKAYAIAVSGMSAWIEKLLELMEDRDVARVAGEALAIITGVDLEESELDDAEVCDDCDFIKKEQEAKEKSTRSSKRFVHVWEEDLPIPAVEKVYEWWYAQDLKSKSGERYLAGQVISESSLNKILSSGNQSQRQIASLHLSLNFSYRWTDINQC